MEHMRRTMPELKEIREAFPLPEGFEKFALFNPVYRNIEYAVESCTDLIDSLIHVSVTDTIKQSAAALKDYEEKENN